MYYSKRHLRRIKRDLRTPAHQFFSTSMTSLFVKIYIRHWCGRSVPTPPPYGLPMWTPNMLSICCLKVYSFVYYRLKKCNKCKHNCVFVLYLFCFLINYPYPYPTPLSWNWGCLRIATAATKETRWDISRDSDRFYCSYPRSPMPTTPGKSPLIRCMDFSRKRRFKF